MGGAYTGYALPFDEFAATATGIGYNMAASIPILGGVISKIIFGGSFPSSATIPRLFFLHVLVIPLLIAGGLAIHMVVLMRQKHTEATRDDDVEPVADGAETTHEDDPAVTADGGTGERVNKDDDSVVVGLPAFPNQAAVSAVVFFLTAALLAFLAGFLPVHNIAEYGPNNPATTPDLIMPDWFLMWLYGFLKLWPTWLSFDLGPLHFSTEFLGGIVVPSLVLLVVFAWPFIDRNEPIHFTTDPLDRAWQTGAGVAGITFIMVASIAGMNNLLGKAVGAPTEVLNPILIIALVGVPLLAFGIVYTTLREPPETTPEGSPDEEDSHDD
jgi:cytochrome b-561